MSLVTTGVRSKCLFCTYDTYIEKILPAEDIVIKIYCWDLGSTDKCAFFFQGLISVPVTFNVYGYKSGYSKAMVAKVLFCLINSLVISNTV